MEGCCKFIGKVAFFLIVIGAINWGLIGLFNFNLVTTLFGDTMITKGVYILVGVAAVYKLICKCMWCSSSSSCCKK